MNIAIIGSGIAGLTCAWRLAGHHQVTLFEAGATPGGHTATVDVATPQGTGHRYRIYRLQRSHLSALYGPAQRAGDRRAKNADELLGPQPGQRRPGVQRPQPDLALRPAAQSAEAGLLGTAERDRPLQPAGETGADRGAGSGRDAGELPRPPPSAPSSPATIFCRWGRPSGRRRCRRCAASRCRCFCASLKTTVCWIFAIARNGTWCPAVPGNTFAPCSPGSAIAGSTPQRAGAAGGPPPGGVTLRLASGEAHFDQ